MTVTLTLRRGGEIALVPGTQVSYQVILFLLCSLCSFSISDLLLVEAIFDPGIFYPGRSLGFLPAPPLARSWGGDSGASWFHSKRKSLHCPGARTQAGGGGGGDRGNELSECQIPFPLSRRYFPYQFLNIWIVARSSFYFLNI